MRLGVLDIPAFRDDAGAPLVFCPGWGGGIGGWHHVARLIARKTGRRVVVITAPGWRSRDARSFFKRRTSQGRLADNVCEQMDRLGLKGAIGIGHSMAGVYLTMAAAASAARFSRLILVCPAGFIDHDNIWHLAGRLFKKAMWSIAYARRQPQLRGPTLVGLLEGLLYPLCNPFAFKEALDLAKARANPPVDTFLVVAKRDAIYPGRRILVPPGTTVVHAKGQHDLQYDRLRFADLIVSLLTRRPRRFSKSFSFIE